MFRANASTFTLYKTLTMDRRVVAAFAKACALIHVPVLCVCVC